MLFKDNSSWLLLSSEKHLLHGVPSDFRHATSTYLTATYLQSCWNGVVQGVMMRMSFRRKTWSSWVYKKRFKKYPKPEKLSCFFCVSLHDGAWCEAVTFDLPFLDNLAILSQNLHFSCGADTSLALKVEQVMNSCLKPLARRWPAVPNYAPWQKHGRRGDQVRTAWNGLQYISSSWTSLNSVTLWTYLRQTLGNLWGCMRMVFEKWGCREEILYMQRLLLYFSIFNHRYR